MADPYQILGVAREATSAEIRKAYLRLAKKNHPDIHPGDKDAETRFKEIASAFGIVGDEAKRVLFDSGKIDASGAEKHEQPERPSYRRHAEAQPGFKYERHWNGDGHGDDDMFAELFGRHARMQARGADVTYTFTVDFLEAINGARKRVVMADSRTLDISIPAGLQDGQVLRLRGQGRPGHDGGETGDVLVVVHVASHPQFRRDGSTIRSILPVTPGEAMAGAKLDIETASGTVTLTVPKGSNTGTMLRLRGKGVPSKGGNGDHVVELQVILPPAPDDELIQAIVAWEAKHPYDPRKEPGVHS